MKSIVIYYSYGGNTRKIAGKIQKALNADMAEIKTVNPFATNGGWIGHTFQDFRNACEGAQALEGLNVRFNEETQLTPDKDIQKWIQGIR